MDLVLIEQNGNGGDLILQGNDLAVCTGYENIPYLSMCGGSDWWGNEFLDPAQQFNSLTEKTLRQYALNSAGRVAIEQAVN
jgi:hypothetical protein